MACGSPVHVFVYMFIFSLSLPSVLYPFWILQTNSTSVQQYSGDKKKGNGRRLYMDGKIHTTHPENEIIQGKN